MNQDITVGSAGDFLRRILGGGISSIVAVVVIVFVLFNSFEVVGAGERGVVFSKFGGVQEGVLGEGLRFKIPFIQTIIPIDVRIQKSETDASASSKLAAKGPATNKGTGFSVWRPWRSSSMLP